MDATHATPKTHASLLEEEAEHHVEQASRAPEGWMVVYRLRHEALAAACRAGAAALRAQKEEG